MAAPQNLTGGSLGHLEYMEIRVKHNQTEITYVKTAIIMHFLS